MPMWSARRPIERPSRPSIVASFAAASRIAARLRSPSERPFRRYEPEGVVRRSPIALDNLARPFVLFNRERPIVLIREAAVEPLPRSTAELRSEWRNELLAPVGVHALRAMI